MPLASPRPKKVGHEHPVRQATGISFDLKVYGKSLQTQAIYAKTASTECQRAGWGWKNSDAHDTQFWPRRALVQAAGTTSKVILRLGAVLSAPASQSDCSACSLSYSSGQGIWGQGSPALLLLSYRSRQRHWAIKTRDHIGFCSIKEEFEVHVNVHCPWSPHSYSFLCETR